jgi:hypothetical protein
MKAKKQSIIFYWNANTSKPFFKVQQIGGNNNDVPNSLSIFV